MKKPAELTVRAIIALVVAFVLGIGAGGLVEHERVQHERHKTTSTAPPTTTTTATNVLWFHKPTKAACPDLAKWAKAAGAAEVALVGKSPWTTTQKALLAQSAAASAALRALLPHANKVGKKGLHVLLNREVKNVAVLKAAKTEAAYATAVKPLAAPAVGKATLVMSAANSTCTKAATGSTTTTATGSTTTTTTASTTTT